MQQWEGYDQQYEALWQWLKETEAKLRTEAGLRTQLSEKQRQRDTFSLIRTDVAAHRAGMTSVREQAEEISKTNGDGRVAANAKQLTTRYETLESNVQV